MRTGGGQFHLTYCTNVHPAEDWEHTFANLCEYCLPLKERLAPQAPFGVGLRLSNRAAAELLAGERLAQFRSWLDRAGLYVFTLNGFPYGVFHGEQVKDQVYLPDWRDAQRIAYTRRLARILSALLPQGLDGSISTMPLSYKPWLANSGETEATLRACCAGLVEAVHDLALIRAESGVLLHLDLEPEPDCLLEDSDGAIRFFHDWLLPVGTPLLAQRMGCARETAERALREHVRLCYDACHFAVAFEDPNDALRRLQGAGIHIGKIQISSALKVPLPASAGARRALGQRLAAFVEPTYLHQVVGRTADGRRIRYPDLGAALGDIETSEADEWRIHFHVPVFLERYETLHSTQADLAQLLDALNAQPLCRHLEIETYTWSVLPEALKTDLRGSIEREYEWVIERLNQD